VRRTKEPEACKPCFSSTSFVIAVSIISGWLTFTATRATSRRLQRKRCVWQCMQDVESLLGAKMPRPDSRYARDSHQSDGLRNQLRVRAFKQVVACGLRAAHGPLALFPAPAPHEDPGVHANKVGGGAGRAYWCAAGQKRGAHWRPGALHRPAWAQELHLAVCAPIDIMLQDMAIALRPR